MSVATVGLRMVFANRRCGMFAAPVTMTRPFAAAFVMAVKSNVHPMMVAPTWARTESAVMVVFDQTQRHPTILRLPAVGP